MLGTLSEECEAQVHKLLIVFFSVLRSVAN